MSEKLERVVAEEQLRPGLLVEIKQCSVCPRDHRHILLGKSRSDAVCAHCDRPVATHWAIPQPTHKGKGPFICTKALIPEGRLFIVDVGDTRDLHERTDKPVSVTNE